MQTKELVQQRFQKRRTLFKSITYASKWSVHEVYMNCTKKRVQSMYGSCMVQVQFKYSPCTVHVQFKYSVGTVQSVCCAGFRVYLFVYIRIYTCIWFGGIHCIYTCIYFPGIHIHRIYVYCIPYKILFKNIICNRKIFTGLAPYRALILQDGLQRNISNLFQGKPYIKLILICYRSLLI